MKDPIQLDAFLSRTERDNGMQQAIDHADAILDNWSEHAMSLLKKYLRHHTGEFMTEDVRKYAEDILFPSPPDDRAWGGIMVRAKNAGLIRKIRLQECKNKSGHRHPVGVWKKV
jgi:hypothetical protein